jgi:MmyB-like transcription regulator ligand binding domain
MFRGDKNRLVVGEITLDSDTFTYDADPDQVLMVYTAEPGSPSEQALRILAFSAPSEHEPARSSTD